MSRRRRLVGRRRRCSDEGHDVTGVTLKLWGGESDTGCCSVPTSTTPAGSPTSSASTTTSSTSATSSTATWSSPTSTPTPPAARRTRASSATAHQVRPPCSAGPAPRLRRRRHRPPRPGAATGPRVAPRRADRAKDQSYVLYMLGQATARPGAASRSGDLTKAEVRQGPPRSACARRPSPTARTSASSPPPAGTAGFLERTALTPGRLVDVGSGRRSAHRRRRAGHRRASAAAWAWRPADRPLRVDVDVATATVTVGTAEDLLADDRSTSGPHRLGDRDAGAGRRPRAELGPRPTPGAATDGTARSRWGEPQRRVAPGQSGGLLRR